MARKFTAKPITAASSERSDGYTEAVDDLEDNFDYALDGFENYVEIVKRAKD